VTTLAPALLLAVLVTWAVTPLAIRLAHLTGFIDRPAGYKGHHAPTPYLGGSAIMVGILVAALSFGGAGGGRWVLVAGAIVLWVLGTADDRLNLSPLVRVVAEAAVAAMLYATGHGWGLHPGILDLLLTIAWVIGVVNAVNLMDNMDGTAGAVAGASALAAAALAIVVGDTGLAVLSLAVAGACAGFLPRNLSRPARIFMGDGGSMPLGFLLAGVTMAASAHGSLGPGALVIGGLLVGLALLDTALVTFSRRVGGRPLLTGARDHLTHRLRTRLGSAQAVAACLGGAQLLVGAGAVALQGNGLSAVLTAGMLALMLAGIAIARLNIWPWFDRRNGPRLGPEHRRAPRRTLVGRAAKPAAETVST